MVGKVYDQLAKLQGQNGCMAYFVKAVLHASQGHQKD